MLKSIFLTLTCIVFSLCLKAQPFVIGGQHYTIPRFDTDTVELTNGWAMASKMLPPVRSSKDDIEIRIHMGTVWLSEPETLLCIRGNRDSLTATAYEVHLFRAPEPSGQYHKLRIDSTHNLFYKTRRISNTPALHALLHRLIEHHLFTYQDEMHIIKALNEAGVQPTTHTTMDVYTDNLVEINLQGKYHSFYYNEQNHTLYPKRKELAWNRKMGADVNNLLKLIKD
ncbi:hypothetical protein GCM10027037_21840 [Mucilaginibacter koreensis]